MKHNRTQPPITPQADTLSVGHILWLVALSILFFLAVCFSTQATIKNTALVLMCLTMFGGILRFPVLRERVKLPVILLILVVLMNGISMTYAQSGKFALYEFLKLAIALCAALLLLLFAPGEGTTPGRRIATVLETCAALSGLFSVDLISTRLLSTPFLTFLCKFSDVYTDLAGVESGVRMTSIFDAPNVFAGCIGIGLLLSLGLTMSADGKREKYFHLSCLYINATSFVLAFSMGATASIAAAFLVYLLLEHKDHRSELLMLMIKTFLLTMVSVVICSTTALEEWSGINPIPMLCLIVGAALLCLADQHIGNKLVEALHTKGKALLISVAAIVAFFVVFALAAYNLTGSVTLNSGESLRRAAYPAPGEYTLAAQGGEGVQVTIESQNQQDTMMHTSTVLYSGTLSDVSFTVPEDSRVVYFSFTAGEDTKLESVQYEGTSETGSVPLGYLLLPDFIANRLQGLFANQNAIQRLVFFQDGMKLFKQSPVIGLGLGSFENGIHGVQSFYYETKYVHNHYIQTLLDTGVVGFILFAGLLGVSAVAILFARKKDTFHPLTPVLGGALVFMGIHAATEVVFSAYPYLPLAFGVFILINLCCGDALPTPWLVPAVKTGTFIVTEACTLIFMALLFCNVLAQHIVESNPTFENVEQAIRLDKFEWSDHALSYVLGSMNAGAPSDIRSQAELYAEELSQLNSNAIPMYLTHYYLSKGEVAKGMEMAEKYVKYCAANSDTWNEIISILAAYESSSTQYRNGVTHIAELLEEWDSENIGTITLDENLAAFLDRVSTQ